MVTKLVTVTCDTLEDRPVVGAGFGFTVCLLGSVREHTKQTSEETGRSENIKTDGLVHGRKDSLYMCINRNCLANLQFLNI